MCECVCVCVYMEDAEIHPTYDKMIALEARSDLK